MILQQSSQSSIFFFFTQLADRPTSSAAVSAGNRCGNGSCLSASYVSLRYISEIVAETVYPRTTPAVVYFPKGCVDVSQSTAAADSFEIRTYLVSASILAYYYTQIIGDAKNPPTLLAAANFTGLAVIGSSRSYNVYPRWLIQVQMLTPTFPEETVLNGMSIKVICTFIYLCYRISI
jgi:hypothetical protein